MQIYTLNTKNFNQVQKNLLVLTKKCDKNMWRILILNPNIIINISLLEPINY